MSVSKTGPNNGPTFDAAQALERNVQGAHPTSRMSSEDELRETVIRAAIAWRRMFQGDAQEETLHGLAPEVQALAAAVDKLLAGKRKA